MPSFIHEFKPIAQAGGVSDSFVGQKAFFFAAGTELPDHYLQKLASAADDLPVVNLAGFTELIKREAGEYSVAAGVLTGEILYLAAAGRAQIYLVRDGKRQLIIGDNCASGLPAAGDSFVLTLPEATEAGLFINFDKSERLPPKIAAPSFLTKKWLTAGAVFVLLAILVWSVGFGLKRRADAILKKQLRTYQVKIGQSLTEAADAAQAESLRSQELIAQAKKELEQIKKLAGRRDIVALADLAKTIIKAEKNILKKEEKSYEEFYDLALIEKNARGERLAADGDLTATLDRDRGKIYLLSLSQKSAETLSHQNLKDAEAIALSGREVFIYGRGGIVKFDRDKKSAVVIPPDPDWGRPAGISAYAGNLYLLDTGRDEIYKYPVIEAGYGAKTSYFKRGQSLDLAAANSMAIDGSVYLGTPAAVYKYTAGGRDGFGLNLPEEGKANFTKVFTDKTLTRVYLWDREAGKIFIVSKTGAFERQIISAIFKKASDFIVWEKSIFVLAGSKIHRVSLN